MMAARMGLQFTLRLGGGGQMECASYWKQGGLIDYLFLCNSTSFEVKNAAVW